jgi:hypothetical protein
MTTHLLIWNPSKYNWERFWNQSADIGKQSQAFVEKWSCPKNVKSGDRIILMKLGSDFKGRRLSDADKGIIGYGYAARDGFLDKSWRDTNKESMFVSIDFISLGLLPIVPIEDLKSLCGRTNFWTPQRAKLLITDQDIDDYLGKFLTWLD